VKKTKQPGENISLKTKKTEDPSVMIWINAQTNLMDSLRYLIENEILQNGVRNLQTVIPMERNVLTINPSLQDRTLNVFHSEPSSTAAAVAAVGMRELQESREEVLAGKSDQQEEPEHPIPSAHREDTKPPEGAEHSELEPSDDEEIDDDDIEAWI
jgi:hypothetical protein